MENTRQKNGQKKRMRQLCSFVVDGRIFGVDILDVKEVNPEICFTPIFHAPESVKGYVNIRGQIHLILDFRLILGVETREPDEKSRLILFKPWVGENFGILVDRIGDVMEAEEDVIEDRREKNDIVPEERDRRKSEIGCGVFKSGAGLMLIIEPRQLLKAIF